MQNERARLEAIGRTERSLLGACLKDNSVLDDVCQIVRPSDFREDIHQKLYDALQTLRESGRVADLITVANVLRERQQLTTGIYGLMGEIWSQTPTGAFALQYAAKVQEDSLGRRFAETATRICREALDHSAPAREAIEQAEKDIFALTSEAVRDQSLPLDQCLSERVDQIDSRCRNIGTSSGVPTGFQDLDAILAGLQPEFYVIAARPSIGKTALGVALIRNVAGAGCPVYFASLEQSRGEISERLLCSEARVDSQRVRKGVISRDESGKLADARHRLGKCKVWIDDSADQSMVRIAAKARRHRRRDGIGLLVVDYLQLVTPDDRKAPRHEQVSSISRRLHQLAREIAIPVIALAQVNRGSEDRVGQKPRLSDLRESGGIEADADTVLLMHRPAQQPVGPVGLIDVEVAKQRNGPTGDVTLAFRKEYTRFEDYQPDWRN